MLKSHFLRHRGIRVLQEKYLKRTFTKITNKKYNILSSSFSKTSKGNIFIFHNYAECLIIEQLEIFWKYLKSVLYLNANASPLCSIFRNKGWFFFSFVDLQMETFEFRFIWCFLIKVKISNSALKSCAIIMKICFFTEINTHKR